MLFRSVFGIESIDVALKEDINQALSGFFTQFATYDAPNDASRAFLNIDYESYLVGDSIASVVYHILYDAPDYTNPIQEIHTRVFLLSTMEEISSDRVLTGNYLDLFSEKAIEYVTTHNELNQTYDYTQYQENLQPLQKNFEKFLITKDGVTLFFEPYTIAPGEIGRAHV